MNKRGFTLVEILSIIAVLSVMVLLIFPNIGGSTEDKKEKELQKIIGIVENAGKSYFSFNNDEYRIPINTLIEEEYLVSDITNPKTGEKLNGCVYVTLDNEGIYEYTYGSCDDINVSFSVELNGGTPSQEFQTKYNPSTKIELIDPTHESFIFKGWKLVKGNSILKGNTLIIGTTETILFAMWDVTSRLTIDLDGGTIVEDKNGAYRSGTTIDLGVPTKTGYTFTGWEITQGNGSLSGNTFTIGNENVMVKATWQLNSPIESYYCANGSAGSSYLFTYTGNCTVIDDGNSNWRVKFLTSGTLTSNYDLEIDAFLVGGGAGGGVGRDPGNGHPGGGGYFENIYNIEVLANTSYVITIGDGGASGYWSSDTCGTGCWDGKSGGATSAFGITANGGDAGPNGWGGYAGGYLSTTTAFSEGGNTYSGQNSNGNSGTTNKGDGGGGGTCAACSGGSGGSGIVIIRNSRRKTDIEEIKNFTYTGDCLVVDEGEGNWQIKLLSSGILKINNDVSIDAFLLGGGGGGGVGRDPGNGHPGGGGYFENIYNIDLSGETEYTVTVGNGGAFGFWPRDPRDTCGTGCWDGKSGGATTAFGITANGGDAGPNGWGGYAGGYLSTTTAFSEGGNTYSGQNSNGNSGTTNKGDGGGGGACATCSGGSGGSGIVVIRNKR